MGLVPGLIGLADDQLIVAGTMEELRDVDFGPPLHCLIIAGALRPHPHRPLCALHVVEGVVSPKHTFPPKYPLPKIPTSTPTPTLMLLSVPPVPPVPPVPSVLPVPHAAGDVHVVEEEMVAFYRTAAAQAKLPAGREDDEEDEGEQEPPTGLL